MPYLEISKEVKEALDVVKLTPYPLYALLNRENPGFDAESTKLALNVLYKWVTNEPSQLNEELALRYILGEDTVKVKPAEFKLLKGATITLGTGDVVTLSKDLTVQGDIRG